MEVFVPREGCKGKAGRKRKKKRKTKQLSCPSTLKVKGMLIENSSQRSQNNKRNTERDCLEEESLCCIFLTAFKLGENRKGGWTDPSISKHVVPAWLQPGCVPGCLQKPREVAYPCPSDMWKLFLDTAVLHWTRKRNKTEKVPAQQLREFFPLLFCLGLLFLSPL